MASLRLESFLFESGLEPFHAEPLRSCIHVLRSFFSLHQDRILQRMQRVQMRYKSGTHSHSKFIPTRLASSLSPSSCDPMQVSIICPRELAAPVLPADRYGPGLAL